MIQRSSSNGDRAVWVSKINSSANRAVNVASSLLQRWTQSFRPATPACEVSFAAVEGLEDRRLFASVTLSNHVLKIVGDVDSPNKIAADVNPNWTMITGKVNGIEKTYKLNQVFDVQFIGGKQADRIWIDPQLTRDVYVHDGGGEDVLTGRKTGILPVPGMADNNEDPAPATPVESAPPPTPGADPIENNSGDDEGSVVEEPWTGTDNSGETGAPRPIIETIGQTGMAGHTVHVDGTQTVLNGGSPIDARYHWDFGDSGSAYNQLEGFNAAHHYTKPGTYTVTLRVTNANGKTGITKTTVQINPDTRRAIYVDRQGSDGNDGSWDRPIQSVYKALSMMDENTKILLSRGDTWDISSTLNIDEDNVTFGAYGSGNDPVLRWTGVRQTTTMLNVSQVASDVVIDNITFDSKYSNDSDAALPVAISPRGGNITATDNTFLNVGFGLNSNGKPHGVLAQNNSAPLEDGLREYFAWVEGTDHVYLGNDVANSTRQHVVRIENGFSRVLLADNDFANISRGGADTAKTTINVQSGQYVTVIGNHIEHGALSIGPLGGSQGMLRDNYTSERSRFGVFRDNMVEDTEINVSHGSENVMITNNRFDRDNKSVINIYGYNTTYQRGLKDIRVIHNTGVNNGTQGAFMSVYGGGTDDIILNNNLYVAPNMVTGSYQSAVLYIANSDLKRFAQIKNNVWADPTKLGYAQGGIMYVYSYWSNQQGYRTPSEWDAMGADGDRFLDASPDDAGELNAGAVL